MEQSYVRELATLIQVRHVYTPMKHAVTFSPSDDEATATRVMTDSAFDYAPVVESDRVTGLVARADLDPQSYDALETKVRQLTAPMLVSGDTPIGPLMAGLEDDRFLLVVEGRDITGLVTPSDLNKHPGRTYLYLLIASLEISVADMIRVEFVDQGVLLDQLPEGRRKMIDDRLQDLQDRDVEADVVAAMDFVDLLTVVKKNSGLLDRFGEFTPRSWQRKVVKPLSDLRHEVMHGVRTLARDDNDSLDRLIHLDRLLRGLIQL